jgi:hypothetical protein
MNTSTATADLNLLIKNNPVKVSTRAQIAPDLASAEAAHLAAKSMAKCTSAAI